MTFSRLTLALAMPAALALLAASAGLATAAIPPAPAQAVAAAQGAATPAAGVPKAGNYSYTASGPANPTKPPALPGNGQADNSRYKWSDNRWWYWTSDNQWMIYGKAGWTSPQNGGDYVVGSNGQQLPYVVGIPSGYTYGPIGSKYYSYPGYGNYYPNHSGIDSGAYFSNNSNADTRNRFPSNTNSGSGGYFSHNVNGGNGGSAPSRFSANTPGMFSK